MAAFERTSPTAPMPKGEICGPVCDYPGKIASTISYGLPFDETVVKHIKSDAKVYLLASPSLCKNTDSLERMKKALGERLKDVRMGMTQHTLYSECLEVAAAAKAVDADTIITLGAGSLADAAKFVCSSMVNTYESLADLEKYNIVKTGEGFGSKTSAKQFHDKMTLIMIPTSLSGGEHTPVSGITEDKTKRKYQIEVGGANVIILDPWLATHTPKRIWLQSGVRGIDHGVEHGCSIGGNDQSTELCFRGLTLLLSGLLASNKDEEDVAARLNAQLGVALVITPLLWGVYAGASHGIGHMLGPMGVGHGETSCILLPAVCDFNESVSGPKHRQIAETLWKVPIVAELLKSKGLSDSSDPPARLSAILDVIIRDLDMPRTLREKGIVGQDKLDKLAKVSLDDVFLQTNPIKITTEEQVMEILKKVEG